MNATSSDKTCFRFFFTKNLLSTLLLLNRNRLQVEMSQGQHLFIFLQIPERTIKVSINTPGMFYKKLNFSVFLI